MASSSAEEIEWIKSLAVGDDTALEKIYHRYKNRIYNLALQYVYDISLAEEIVQDVFLAIHRQAKSFQFASQPKTWIYQIAIHTSIDALRRKNRKKRWYLKITFDQALEKPSLDQLPDDFLINEENSKRLYEAINELPEKLKTAFILVFIEDLPQKEVADILKISLKATESILQRAKQNLRKKLKDLYAFDD